MLLRVQGTAPHDTSFGSSPPSRCYRDDEPRFGAVVGFGDWSEFLNGLEPRDVWKAGIIGSGLVFAGVGYALPLRLWMPRLSGRRRVLLSVTVIPVAIVLLVQTRPE